MVLILINTSYIIGETKKNIYLCHTTQLPEKQLTQLHYMSSDTSKRYALRGVSAGKDVHNAIKNIDKVISSSVL
jgi:hypothetical protein